MEIIVDYEYELLRELYKLYFTKEYKENIKSNNYFWENLKEYNRKSEYFCQEIIKTKKSIFVMWDTYDNFTILDVNYFKYPRKSLLKMSPDEFFLKKDSFPEDIYVFDDTFSWTVIFTHEEVLSKKRYCLAIT